MKARASFSLLLVGVAFALLPAAEAGRNDPLCIDLGKPIPTVGYSDECGEGEPSVPVSHQELDDALSQIFDPDHSPLPIG